MKIIRVLSVLFIALMIFSCKPPITELLQLDEPIFNPISGTYLAGQAITITQSEYGSTIYYTLDGTIPTEQSSVYTAPLIIPNFFPPDTTSCTIKVKAFKTGFDPSNTVTATYTVTYFNTVSIPHFSPLSGDITTTTEITIFSTTANAVIHYTIDGTEPTEDSPVYTALITFPVAGDYTLKAKAWKPNWNPSPLATTTYTVTE